MLIPVYLVSEVLFTTVFCTVVPRGSQAEGVGIRSCTQPLCVGQIVLILIS